MRARNGGNCKSLSPSYFHLTKRQTKRIRRGLLHINEWYAWVLVTVDSNSKSKARKGVPGRGSASASASLCFLIEKSVNSYCLLPAWKAMSTHFAGSSAVALIEMRFVVQRRFQETKVVLHSKGSCFAAPAIPIPWRALCLKEKLNYRV